MATPRDLRLALHPNSDEPNGELITDHILKLCPALSGKPAALMCWAIMGNVRAIPVRVAHVRQPGQGFMFKLLFGHGCSMGPIKSCC